MKYNRETGQVEGTLQEIEIIIRGIPVIQDLIRALAEAHKLEIKIENPEVTLTPETSEEVAKIAIEILEGMKTIQFTTNPIKS